MDAKKTLRVLFCMGINQNFFDNSYIDILLKDIEYFESVNQDINYIFFIKQKSKKRELYTMYKLN